MRSAVFAIIVFLILPLSIYAENTRKTLRIYHEKEKGEIVYSVVHPWKVNSMVWYENDKLIEIKSGAGIQNIKVANESEALKIIEAVMGSKSEEWISVDEN